MNAAADFACGLPSAAAVGVVFLAGLAAPPSLAASATGHATATILPAIAVSENAPMNLGTVGITKAGGRIVLSPLGRATGPSGYAFNGTPRAGSFTVAGTPNAAVSISVSAGDALSGPGPALPLGAFTDDAGAVPALSRTGTLTVAVGATVTVGAAQPTGTYAGSYRVVVNY